MPTDNWRTPAVRALEELVDKVIADEREACAKVADKLIGREPDDVDVAKEIALRIRIRPTSANRPV